MNSKDQYAHFVKHPLYGHRPIQTKLQPSVSIDEEFVLESRPSDDVQIEGTTVLADMEKIKVQLKHLQDKHNQ